MVEKKLFSSNPPLNHIKVLDGGQGWIGLLNHMGEEITICNSARVSFDSMKDTFDDKDEKLLKYLIKNEHLTPLEHVQFTFSIHCPLFIRSQWMRHRMWSYNEISRRYTDVNIEFYIPNRLREQSEDNKQGSIEDEVENNDELVKALKVVCETALSTYNGLLANGVCREQARMVLPQNLMTTFWATVDLRNLLHFLKLRDDNHAQLEIREYAAAIKKLIAPFFPTVAKIYGWQ